jgi:hypothetical protein
MKKGIFSIIVYTYLMLYTIMCLADEKTINSNLPPMKMPALETQKVDNDTKTTITVQAVSPENKDNTAEKQKQEEILQSNKQNKIEATPQTESKPTENVKQTQEEQDKKLTQTPKETTAVMQEIAPVEDNNKKNKNTNKTTSKEKNEILKTALQPKKESCMSQCTKSCTKKCTPKKNVKKIPLVAKPKKTTKPVVYDFTKVKKQKSPITEIECISCQRNINIHDDNDEILLELNTENVEAKIHKHTQPKKPLNNNQIDHAAIMSYINELVDARIKERDKNNISNNNSQTTKTQDGKTLVIVENIFYDNNGNRTSTQTQNIQYNKQQTEESPKQSVEKKDKIGENVVDRKFSFVGERRYVDNRDYYQIEKQKYAEEYAFLEDNDNGY